MTVQEAKKYITPEIKVKITELSGVQEATINKVLRGDIKESKCIKWIIQFALVEKGLIDTKVKEFYTPKNKKNAKQ